MNAYSKELKETLIQKMLDPKGPKIKELSEQTGIKINTLHYWRRSYVNSNGMSKKSKSKEISKVKMLEILNATSSMNEEDLGAYLRKNGLVKADLERFKAELTGLEDKSQIAKARSEVRELKQDKKQLSRELRRKEKALAEATAILIMKKKAELIWGKGEDDETE